MPGILVLQEGVMRSEGTAAGGGWGRTWIPRAMEEVWTSSETTDMGRFVVQKTFSGCRVETKEGRKGTGTPARRLLYARDEGSWN